MTTLERINKKLVNHKLFKGLPVNITILFSDLHFSFEEESGYDENIKSFKELENICDEYEICKMKESTNAIHISNYSKGCFMSIWIKKNK